MGVTTTCKTIPSPTNARLVFITNKIFTLLNNCLKNATAWHTDILLSLNDILKNVLKSNVLLLECVRIFMYIRLWKLVKNWK